MRDVILYFGSFNPVHCGHLKLVEYVSRELRPDEVRMIVSPRNPLKEDSSLAPEQDRLAMARIAVRALPGECRATVSDVEFGLPRPSYTIDTVRYLKEHEPDTRFSILTGADIMCEIGRWKESELLMEECRFYVYPRDGYMVPDDLAAKVVYLEDAPVFPISSTGIRSMISRGTLQDGLLPEGVYEYIEKHRLWTKNN